MTKVSSINESKLAGDNNLNSISSEKQPVITNGHILMKLDKMSSKFISTKDESKTPLQQFYAGKVLLITGGTGFLGKLIIEKLLRLCPDIGHIYIIVRHKRGKTGSERIDEYFNDEVFDRLKKENPNYRNKLTGIIGDMRSPMLGLSEPDQLFLKNTINILIHGAATVNFTEKLQIAVGINLIGTQRLLELAKQFINLQAFIHVSTAYSNCHMGDIDERVYEYPGTITWSRLIQLMDCLEDCQIDSMTPMLVGNWPNTYTFTKALAERMLSETKQNVPLGIFRPAIITSTANEPIPGWIDNSYGPTGVLAGMYAGVVRTMRADKNCTANIVPGDMVASAIIASAWDVSSLYEKNQRNESTSIPIYNYVSTDNPITWGDVYNYAWDFHKDYPALTAVWHPNCYMVKSKFLMIILQLVLLDIPGNIIDFGLKFTGKSSRTIKYVKKAEKLLQVIEFFSMRSWHYGTYHITALWNKLNEADKQLFDFSIKGLEWDAYFVSYIKGIRQYVLKDDISTLPQAKQRAVKLYWMSITVTLLVTTFILAVTILLYLSVF